MEYPVTDGFVPTRMWWYNDTEGAKVPTADIGSYEAIPYGYTHPGHKHVTGKPPHPEYGQWQEGFSCSKTSRMIIADVDHPEHWQEGATFVQLGGLAECATSYRSDLEKFHIIIVVPEELTYLWPTQGPTIWGDTKSNGFSYHTGVHAKGHQYVASANPWIIADADLLHALTEDRIFPQGHGATGVASGAWWEEGYQITSHDQCVADVYSMADSGLDHGEIFSRLEDIMPNREGAWTGREAYIDEKISSAFRKIDMREAKERARWNSFHPGGYEALVQDIERRRVENIERATPAGIQADTTEFIEHRIAEGTDLRTWPLADRLNPLRRPLEPRGSTDKGNATDILETGLQVFRLAADEGCWLVNTGTFWVPWGTKSDKQEIARAIVSAYGQYMKTDEALTQEMAAEGTAESPDQIARDAARAERLGKNRSKFWNSPGQGTIGSALCTEARTSDRYSVMAAELDSEADVLWAGGYPWSLRHPSLTLANTVREVNPVHLKTAACAPSPGPAPAFDQVLEAVWPDPELRAWALREIAGVMLWGSTSKMHPVLDGPPGGGKSTFALILTRVLGSYAVQVSPDKILGGDTSSAHEEEVAAMIGARCVWMDEPPPGGRQSISRFNDLASGTGQIAAARKYMNRVSAPKLFNFLICQNPRNGLRMDAQGVGERMTFIPCNGTPEATRAAWERWKKEGEAEYAAILARLITECALFHSGERLLSPSGAMLSRMDAQGRADEFGAWVEENYDVLPQDTQTIDKRLDSSPTLAALRTTYNDVFARPNKQPVVSAPEAADQLKRLGVKVGTGGVKRRKSVVFVLPRATAFGY